MRVTLTKDEVLDLILLLESDNNLKKNEVNILKKLKDEFNKPIKLTKRNATKKATKVKVNIAKRKLESTVNIMRLEGKKININSVAKESGLAYNTVKKYSNYVMAR